MTEVTETRGFGYCHFRSGPEDHCYKPFLNGKKIKCARCSNIRYASASDRNKYQLEEFNELNKLLLNADKRICPWKIKQYLTQEMTQYLISYYMIDCIQSIHFPCQVTGHAQREGEEYCLKCGYVSGVDCPEMEFFIEVADRLANHYTKYDTDEGVLLKFLRKFY